MSKIGDKAVVQLIPTIALAIITELPGSATFGPLAQSKTATEATVHADIALTIIGLHSLNNVTGGFRVAGSRYHSLFYSRPCSPQAPEFKACVNKKALDLFQTAQMKATVA